MTPFDLLPYNYSAETIDMLNSKYAELQRSSELINFNISDPFKVAVLNANLIHMADSSTTVNPQDVLRLAAFAVAWVESLFNEGFNG